MRLKISISIFFCISRITFHLLEIARTTYLEKKKFEISKNLLLYVRNALLVDRKFSPYNTKGVRLCLYIFRDMLKSRIIVQIWEG